MYQVYSNSLTIQDEIIIKNNMIKNEIKLVQSSKTFQEMVLLFRIKVSEVQEHVCQIIITKLKPVETKVH